MATPDLYFAVARAGGSVVCGLFGGVLNRILVKRSLGLTANARPEESWEYGLVGDVLIGMGAGLATYFYGMYDLPLGRILLLALFGGGKRRKLLQQCVTAS
jgi:hypothetical protein